MTDLIVLEMPLITLKPKMQEQHSVQIVGIDKNHQKCPVCSWDLIQVQGQRYCQHCKQTPVMLHQDIRIVHQNFRANSEQLRISGLIKIEKHIETILKGLGMFETQSTINQLVQKTAQLHRSRGFNRKGYLEESAVIIFMNFQAEHKMTIRQFCNKFRIQVKKFNKIFLHDRRQKKKLEEQKQVEGSVKIQEKLEDSTLKYEEIYNDSQNDHQISRQRAQNQIKEGEQIVIISSNCSNCQEQINEQNFSQYSHHKSKQQTLAQNSSKKIHFEINNDQQIKSSQNIQKIKCIVMKLYDELFDNFYMQQIKNQMIESISEKLAHIKNIYDGKYRETLRIYSKYQQILYQIFGVLKAYNYKISVKTYKQVVEKVYSLNLNLKKLSIVKKQIQNIIKCSKVPQKEAKKEEEERLYYESQSLEGMHKNRTT